MRRNMTRMDDSLVIVTSDGRKVRIKPFLLTRGKITKSVESTMRATLREELITYVKKTPYDQLFANITKYIMQKEMKERFSKVYPIKAFEIRVLEEENYHTAKETPLPVKKPTKKAKSKKAEDVEEAEEKAEVAQQEEPQKEE
jgi:ribosomal protein S3AE